VNGRRPASPAWQRWGFSIAGRGALMAFGWWALTGGDLRYWLLALGIIGSATAASLIVTPPGHRRWHPVAILRFAWFFGVQSVIGGIDVARRAFDPRMPIAPGIRWYRLHTPSEASQVLIADTVSLLPGSVGVELEDGGLTVHVLDTAMPVEKTLLRLEERVADLLGEPWEEEPA
jgi:multicomponent Na+:H+ antiporter subunit E